MQFDPEKLKKIVCDQIDACHNVDAPGNELTIEDYFVSIIIAVMENADESDAKLLQKTLFQLEVAV